jgi:hypothetical protein
VNSEATSNQAANKDTYARLPARYKTTTIEALIFGASMLFITELFKERNYFIPRSSLQLRSHIPAATEENTLKESGKLLVDATYDPCRNMWNVTQLVTEG